MKIIIDISDKTYEIIKNMIYFYSSQRSGREATKEILTAIKQGIPLPKGHGRLIDADALVKKGDITKDYLNIFAPTIIEADKEYKE